jgi:2-polyprenyl-3-methyl-5-hydroxy-6-metoxy-1,4-benzoquinol methylase
VAKTDSARSGISEGRERVCDQHIYRNSGNLPLLNLASLNRNGVALDLGCGAAGDNAHILAENGWKVFGITLSRGEQECAAQVCIHVWVHDLEDGLPKDLTGPFDLIVLSHVVEHLRNARSLLLQVHKVLAPTGELLVAVPNVLNWHQRVLFLFGHFEYKDEGIMDSTHLAFYTFESARRLIESCSFKVIKAGAAGSILPWGILRRTFPRTTSAIDRFFCALRPSLLGRQLLYLAVPDRSHATP